MRYYDITKPLMEGMRVYSGHERFQRTQTRSVEKDGYNLSVLSLGAHCGTHMDAPLHFLGGGASIEQVPLDVILGEALVVRDLEDAPAGTERVLYRGENGLDAEQARAFVGRGARLIGTERLSVSIDGHEAEVHKILLTGGVWILENLDLSAVPDGRYLLSCLPLPLVGCEGAPARAVLATIDA